MKIRSSVLFFVFAIGLLVASTARAQGDQQFQLGVQYYQQGEIEKAVSVFSDLHKSAPLVQLYYRYLFYCYVQLRNYQALEKLSKAQAKREPMVALYQVDEAYARKLQGEIKQATAAYQRLIKELPANQGAVVALAQAFRSRQELLYATETYLQGRKLLGSPYAFSLDLADLYAAQGKKMDMAQAYLDYLITQPQQLAYIQNMLQARLADDDYEALRLLLIDNMGKRPDDLALAELLIWYFVQERDFESAFVQARAIDRRFRENGYRLMQLAAVALENNAFAAAHKCYSAVAEKTDAGGLALEANYRMLSTRQAQLEADGAQRADWEALATAYQDFMQRYPLFTLLPELKQALAALWAFQLQRIDSAIQLLDEALTIGRGDQRQLAAIKLDLGDLFLLAEEPYEAALLYGQVEKDYANEPLGQEAKFRNARLSFYRGEFDWAQAQLDVLKASTTQRIANDAIALSLLITENYDMDTVTYPMELFAAADLRAFCRQYAQANYLYDSLLNQYPGHALTDEVLYRKANIALKQQQIDTAARLYQRLLQEYAQDLYGDDALFGWAVLEADKRNNPAEAMRLFERLLLEYPDSHYINEARRRYRTLRGDNIN